MWTMVWSDVNPIAQSISHPRTTITTVVFDLNGIGLIDILPEKNKLNAEYFSVNIIKELDLTVYPTGRKLHSIYMCLHFDNVLSTICE
jgi:hypothetical protein